jgi:hypothetical protein
VTFVFNGGPGAASIYLHLSAIGPKTIATAGDGSFPPVPARLQENPDSWIRFTDLVFIDPVGTGFSRMLPGPDGQLRDHQPAASVGPAAGGTRPSSGPDLSPLGAPRPRLHDPGPWQGRNWPGA